MKKRSLLVFVVCIFLNCAGAQHIDSIQVVPVNPTINDSVGIRVMGWYMNTGVYFSNAVTTISPNLLSIDIYFIQCTGFNVLVPFDTFINAGLLPQGNYVVECKTLSDTVLTDTLNCFHASSIDTFSFVSGSLTVLQTGIEVLQKPFDINVYPVPFINFITFSSGSNELTEIIIYDFTSGKILQQQFNNMASLNTGNLVPGIYMYELKDKNGILKNGKIIKH